MNQDVANAIKDLEREDGTISPQDIVDRARDPDSPLHDHFEWDDGVAAENYRRQQARVLIRKVRVEVTHLGRAVNVPRFIKDPQCPVGETRYRNIADVRSDPDMARDVIVEAVAQINRAVNRMRALKIALDFEDELGAVESAASSITSTIERGEDRHAD